MVFMKDNQNAILELESAMTKTKNVRMYKRYFVILKHFQGFKNKTIAEMDGLEEHEKYDAVVFLEFLKKVLTQYPKGKIVIILDNAKIHHAKLIQAFLKKMKNRLELMFLPPYSPDLNLIEGL